MSSFQWPSQGSGGGSGTVTSVSVVTANGLAGTVSNSTTTPALTLTTTVTGILQGNGTAISAASTTGTGSVVQSISPTFTGTIAAAALTLSTALAIASGGTGVSSVTIAPVASAFAGWDANKNLSANNHIEAYTTTPTAAGITVLAVGSTYQQFFTGVTTQTVTLPVVSTLVLGMQYSIVNLSSGSVTVNSSGANTVQVMTANTTLLLTCILVTGTTTTSWSAVYAPLTAGTGSVTAVSVVSANGFTGSSSGGATPALTLATSITGILQGNGTAISAATTTGTGSVVQSISPTLTGTIAAAALTLSTALGVSSGGTGVSSITTAPVASAFAGWDANKNLTANNHIEAYTTTVSSATPITLVVGSTYQQYVTGSTAQTLTLPVASTLVLGQQFYIVNSSSSTTTVNSSGANIIQAMAANSQLVVTCILASGTTAASWSAAYSLLTAASGTVTAVSVVSANGFTGSSSGGATPALTLTTSITGVLKGTGTALTLATAGTDYSVGTSALITGILKSTTTTGALTIAVAADIPIPLTTKGDLYVFAAAGARLAVGGDNKVALADSTATNGLSYQYPVGKNYISNSAFESNTTTNWSLGTVGTLTNAIPTGSPTFGSGASGNLSLATVSSGQLAGAFSLSYVSSAASTAGNMLASAAMTIDAEDQAKVLTFKFYYSAFSGTANCNFSGTSSNSYGVAIWDVTNSAWLTSTANFGMTQGTGSGYVTGTCQTNATTASLRFVVYNANATAGASTLYFDDFYLGPQTAPLGYVGTDPVAYTPTFAGLGTVTGVQVYSWREGPNLFVRGQFVAGTTTGVTASMSLGFNGANGNVTIAGTTAINTITVVGMGVTSVASSPTLTILAATGATVLNFGLINPAGAGANSATLAQTGSGSITSNGTVEFFAQVPIAGWSSNVQMSSDTDTRVIAARINSCTATITGSYSDVAFTTVTNDTAGGYVSPNYTIPVTGYYSFTGQIFVSGTAALNSTTTLGLFNTTTSTTLEEIQDVYGGAVTAAMGIDFNFQEILLTAGTQIKIQVKSSITLPVISASATQNYLAISRRSGPSVIAATESVNTRYFASATAITGSLATIVWTTKDFDSHNGMVSGVYTIPVSGKYQINMALALTAASAAAGNAVDIQLQKNGTVISEFAPVYQGTQILLPVVLDDLISCLAGDTIRIQVSSAATTPSIVSSNSKNFFSLARVGN